MEYTEKLARPAEHKMVVTRKWVFLCLMSAWTFGMAKTPEQTAKPVAKRVCTDCHPGLLPAVALAERAFQARKQGQWPEAEGYYQALRKHYPDQKDGWLGLALVAIDTQRYTQAQGLLAAYKKRFGEDDGFESAQDYWVEQYLSPMEQLAYFQEKISKKPGDRNAVLQTYRAAAKLGAFPVQKNLLQQYPQYFSPGDAVWLAHDEAVKLHKIAVKPSDYQAAYATLQSVYHQSEQDAPVYRKSLQDGVVLAGSASQPKQALSLYRQLSTEEQNAAYVQEAVADAWLATGSPFKAGAVYQRLWLDKEAAGQETFALQRKRIQAAADAQHFDQAWQILESLRPQQRINDFTRTQLLNNDGYQAVYFDKVRVSAWRGDFKQAHQLIDDWLNTLPGDAWGHQLKGDVYRWQGRPDDALKEYREAQSKVPEPNQFAPSVAQVMLDNQNWPEVKSYLAKFGQTDNTDWQEYVRKASKARAPELWIDSSVGRNTHPQELGNENSHNVYLYSQRSLDGYRALVHYHTDEVPVGNDSLRQQRVGAGLDVDRDPWHAQIEAGKGVELNKRGYLSANLDYRLNQSWTLSVNGQINSENTPLRAINQQTYAKEIAASVQYSYSPLWRINLGGSFLDFDDGNHRNSGFASFNHVWLQHDRWQLDQTVRFDWQKNRQLTGVDYYNPDSAHALWTEARVSYSQPFDHNIKLKQSFTLGGGRYWQADYNAEKTWLLQYGQEWQLGAAAFLQLTAGRKRSVYDGRPEYQNFGQLGFGYRFH